MLTKCLSWAFYGRRPKNEEEMKDRFEANHTYIGVMIGTGGFHHLSCFGIATVI